MRGEAPPPGGGAMLARTEVVAGLYQDSVVLMRVAAQVRKAAGVREVALFMGTPANHALLEQAGLASVAGRRAGPNDLIITVRADDEAAAAAGVASVRDLLAESSREHAATAEVRPRSLESALRMLPEANLVALSVPGAYVKAEAMAALRRNLHLFIFSDNVPLADEVALKQEALRRGRFCMGPDQGTAYLGGAALGFANVVARGRVGCVAASGTGLQAVVSRLDALGEGVSHAIGVGGRDLSQQVGGMMTLFALDALARDPATEAIVVVSKPPHPAVLRVLEAKLDMLRKPAVVCCIGAPPRAGGRTLWVATLDEAADAAAAVLAGRAWSARPFTDAHRVRQCLAPPAAAGCAGRRILGLYTGGTLAYETDHVLTGALGADHGQRIVDLGDDEYTVGRPHPMIDPSVRNEMIVRAGDDADVGVVLLDLVLGKGAHENPAQPLVQAVGEAQRRAAAHGRRIAFLASIVGTARDPQGLAAQTEALERAGVGVLASNADAARCAALLGDPALRSRWLP